MCGIAGFSLAPSSTIDVKQLAHYLLQLSEERGIVASGWAMQEGAAVTHLKSAKPGGRLPVRTLPPEAHTVILHTRNATMGDPADNRNNHPLVSESGDVTLIHNGVVKNHELFRKVWTNLPPVDSAVLPELVEKYGLTGLKETTGWAAIAWLDTQTPDTIHLARQGDAPIVLVTLKDGSSIFASTFGIIIVSLKRMGLDTEIEWGYEFEDRQALDLSRGRITGMATVPKYVYAELMFKPATTTSYQTAAEKEEEKRLKAITSGEKYTPPKVTPKSGGTQNKTPQYTPPAGTSPPPPPGQPYKVGPVGSNHHTVIGGHRTASIASVAKLVVAKAVEVKGQPVVDPKDMEARLAAFDDASAHAPSPTSYPVSRSSHTVSPYKPVNSESDSYWDAQADRIAATFQTPAHGFRDNELWESGNDWDGNRSWYASKPIDPNWPCGVVLTYPDGVYAPGRIMPGSLPKDIEERMIYWIEFSDAFTETNYEDYEDFVISHRTAKEGNYLVDWGFFSPFNLEEKLSLKASTSQADEIETIIFNITSLVAEHAAKVAAATAGGQQKEKIT